MARLVGIDIGRSRVRAALLRTSYKRVAIEHLLEAEISDRTSLTAAIQSVGLTLTQHSEPIAVAIAGESAFMHRLNLPATAHKRLDEVLPFEIEAQVPVDIDELVYDYRALRTASAGDQVNVITCAARTEVVRERIELMRRTLMHEPERVGCGPLPLANLAMISAELTTPNPIALVDLGGTRTEVVVLVNGEPAFARTLLRGVEGVVQHDPSSAEALTAELRQSLAAWTSRDGRTLDALYLVGGGAATPGAEAYLTGELGIQVRPLPALDLEGLTPIQAELVPRFAKAISLALGLSGRPRDLDLRRGPLAFQRGFGFLKEKMPLLSGLAAAIAISFAFSTWAQLRALSREHDVLTSALGSLSKEILGEETTDPARAHELLDKKEGKEDADPMPHADGFDVMIALSKGIPMTVTHDIDELDLQRNHVRVDGIVGTTADAQTVLNGLKEYPCVTDAKISKITQAVNSDKQKYVLEFELSCPEDQVVKKKPAAAAEPDKEDVP